MFTLPVGQIALLLLAVFIFLGALERVLDRMRLSDRAAMIIIGLMFIGSFLPPITAGPLAVNVGGGLIPIAICGYLILTADEAREKRRAFAASAVAAAGIIFFDKVLPLEPGEFIYDLDPLFIPAIVAGGIAYGLGRSRRASFVAGVLGVALSDLAAVGENLVRGASGIGVEIGGAGIFDAVIIAGVLAVVLAELTGETAELLSRRGISIDRPAMLRRLLGRMELTNALGSGVSLKAKFYWAAFALLLAIALILGGRSIVGMMGQLDELAPGKYNVLVDELGQTITKTGRQVSVGDKYITGTNDLYVVVAMSGNVAQTEFLEKVDLLQHKLDADFQPASTAADKVQAQAPLIDRIFFFGQRKDLEVEQPESRGRTRQPAEAAPVEKVAIYHTHNAESYVTSDGTDSIYGKGGIHLVGQAFKKSLEDQGITTVYSQNLHLPHDRGAYRRSRRTVTRIMEENPAIMFDIHRDATPSDVYAQKVEETWVTQIQLVVGRQNQNKNLNLEFAKELKAIADQETPGLIKGIFIARGNYNQDLFSRTLLLEVGSHTNARESAQRGMELFAPVVVEYLRQQEEQ